MIARTRTETNKVSRVVVPRSAIVELVPGIPPGATVAVFVHVPAGADCSGRDLDLGERMGDDGQPVDGDTCVEIVWRERETRTREQQLPAGRSNGVAP